jgi:hypothetical protein
VISASGKHVVIEAKASVIVVPICRKRRRLDAAMPCDGHPKPN